MEKREKKDIIIKELKKIVVPCLKELNFHWSFPHFRRKNNERYEFLSFQFNRHGGSFVIEMAYTSQNDLPNFAKDYAFKKLNYGYTNWNNRLRIQPENAAQDFWFSFEHLNSIGKIKNLIKPIKGMIEKNVDKFFNS